MQKWSIKMGAAAAATGAITLYSAYQEGEAAKDAAEQQAADIKIQAEADVKNINQELEDAISMQQVLFGSQGRVVEGSATAVMEGDKKAAKEDIADVRAGAARKSRAVRKAGQTSRDSAWTSGLLGAASTAYKYKQVK